MLKHGAADSAETADFFDTVEAISHTTFDRDRTSTSKANLPFLPDYWLVRAEFERQKVRLHGIPVALQSRAHSYLLFRNHSSENGPRHKLIPIWPATASEIEFINRLLNVQLTPENLISYVKYYGLIAIAHPGMKFKANGGHLGVVTANVGNPTCYLSSRAEIPFSDHATAEQREQVVGALSRGAIGDDGQFEIEIQTDDHFLLGPTYRLSLPCIFEREARFEDIAVTSGGAMRRTVMRAAPIASQEVLEEPAEPSPYLCVASPTDLLEKKNSWVNRRYAVVVGLNAARVLYVVMAIGGFGIAYIGLSDVILGAFYASWTNAIDGLARAHPLVVAWACLGCIAILIAELSFHTVGALGELLGARPSVLGNMYHRTAAKWRARFRTFRSRVIGAISVAVERFVTLCALWGGILYSANVLGANAILQPPQIDLRSSIGYVFGQTLVWLRRGRNSDFFGIFEQVSTSFEQVQQLSGLGEVGRTIMLISLPVLLLARTYTFWRWTKPTVQK